MIKLTSEDFEVLMNNGTLGAVRVNSDQGIRQGYTMFELLHILYISGVKYNL